MSPPTSPLTNDVFVDARGMRCPWPALRLARAMRLSPDATITIAADDPAAPDEITALAEQQGWHIEQRPNGAEGHFRLSR